MFNRKNKFLIRNSIKENYLMKTLRNKEEGEKNKKNKNLLK